MKHDFHNPDGLTPEQIGEGYRLLLKSEIQDRPSNAEIEVWDKGVWNSAGIYSGSSITLTYRVPLSTWPLPEEPWTLGRSVNGFTLGEGQEWHRQDWTKEMLPEGWRPLLSDESLVSDSGDQYKADYLKPDEFGWASFKGSLSSSSHMRTRRPLPPSGAETFTAHSKTWFRHTPGDQMPCDGDARVDLLLKDTSAPGAVNCPAKFLNWTSEISESFQIIGWRYTAETTDQVEQDPSPQGGKWMEHPKAVATAPTDNDAWESLLHTNATLGREVSRLRAEVEALKATLNHIREVLK